LSRQRLDRKALQRSAKVLENGAYPMNRLLLSRRNLLFAIGASGAGCAASRSDTQMPATPLVPSRFAELERRVGGKLGVAALDTGSGKRVEYRAGERFAMCSTFKLPLVAAVLERVDAGHEDLQRRVAFDASVILEYAPVTKLHVEEGSMSVEALCEAAITVSDNTAANLLLETVGGPAGFTERLRAWGDAMSRLDRNEPMLNAALAGDVRDTTTPFAMVGTLQRLLLGHVLSDASKQRLCDWLVATKTGLERLRGGVPPQWRAGDKTGTGNNGATNDVAIVWPPGKAPLLIAAYTWGSQAESEQIVAVLADSAKLVLQELGAA
jgi:beta-lactamase class A